MLRTQLAPGPLALVALVVWLWGGIASAEQALPPTEASESPALEEGYDPLLDEDLDGELSDPAKGDPLEPMNRGIFAFNRFLDRWVFDPVTEAYQFVFPAPVREGINNVFLNLQSPVIFLNHTMQLRGRDAAVTLGRFVVNTTAGGGGFFDAAGRGAGLERVDADFGQTLAAWGTPPGPYIMLPILGPSTLRDATGDLVDRGMDPLTYVVGPIQWWIPIGLSQGLAIRDANHAELKALEEGSLDFYSALRSAYLQSREAVVREAMCGGYGLPVDPET